MHAALMIDKDEAKEKVFRNRLNVFSLHHDTFVDDIFRLIKILAKMICEEVREDLRPVSGVRTVLSVETQVRKV